MAERKMMSHGSMHIASRGKCVVLFILAHSQLHYSTWMDTGYHRYHTLSLSSPQGMCR